MEIFGQIVSDVVREAGPGNTDGKSSENRGIIKLGALLKRKLLAVGRGFESGIQKIDAAYRKGF